MTIKIMFFCLGNICRSPIAEGVFKYHAGRAAVAHRFHVESSGTSAYHVGEAPDRGSQAVVKRRLGVDISGQRAQQLTRAHLTQFDVLIAMDESNRSNAWELVPEARILLLRDFEAGPDKGRGVPDPWGYGAEKFEEVFDIVDHCTSQLLVHLLEREHSR